MGLRFGTDGVRGVALTELTPAYVRLLGSAAAGVLDGSRWYLARDTRASGPELEAALASGLQAAGAEVLLLGMIPTPALAHLAAADGTSAAMITASHNPFMDNGVKIFAVGGRKLTDEVERRIEGALDELRVDEARLVGVVPGTVGYSDGAADRYIDHVVGLFPSGSLAGLRIVLDTANGAMSTVAPVVARRLGADVAVLNDQPDGRNINAACGATDPAALAADVVARGADLGLAFDGDGDRVIAIDHLGNVVDGDRTVALAALQLRDAGELVDDTVVVTVMSNLGFRRAMEQAGITVLETAVGDRYVLEALDAGGLSLGGEQSGHIIYRREASTGDGLLAGLRLAQHLVERGRSLAELAGAVMTSYPQVLVNVRVRERHPGVAEELVAEIAAATDALHGEGRVLVRASGTEPLIRVMVEASTPAVAQRTADDLAAVVRRRFG